MGLLPPGFGLAWQMGGFFPSPLLQCSTFNIRKFAMYKLVIWSQIQAFWAPEQKSSMPIIYHLGSNHLPPSVIHCGL